MQMIRPHQIVSLSRQRSSFSLKSSRIHPRTTAQHHILSSTKSKVWRLHVPIDLNPGSFERMNWQVAMARIKTLFAVRAWIKRLMCQSGSHDDDPMQYVDAAKAKAKASGVARYDVYYFYMICSVRPEIVENFKTTIDDNVKGSSSVRKSPMYLGGTYMHKGTRTSFVPGAADTRVGKRGTVLSTPQAVAQPAMVSWIVTAPKVRLKVEASTSTD